MHSLPREQEEIVNNMLRKYKYEMNIALLVLTDRGIKLDQPQLLSLEFDDSDVITIPAYSTPETEKKKKTNRAKTKRETQALIDEYYESLNDDEYEL